MIADEFVKTIQRTLNFVTKFIPVFFGSQGDENLQEEDVSQNESKLSVKPLNKILSENALNYNIYVRNFHKFKST